MFLLMLNAIPFNLDAELIYKILRNLRLRLFDLWFAPSLGFFWFGLFVFRLRSLIVALLHKRGNYKYYLNVSKSTQNHIIYRIIVNLLFQQTKILKYFETNLIDFLLSIITFQIIMAKKTVKN